MVAAGPTRGGTRGTLYPGPAGSGAREDESTHAKIYFGQAQINGRFLHLQRCWQF